MTFPPTTTHTRTVSHLIKKQNEMREMLNKMKKIRMRKKSLFTNTAN